MRRLIAALAVVIGLVGFTASAAGATPFTSEKAKPKDVDLSMVAGPTPDGAEDGGVIDTLFTSDGKLVRQVEKVQRKGDPDAISAIADEAAEGAVPVMSTFDLIGGDGKSGSGSGGAASANGCRSLEVYKTSYSALGSVVWKWHLQVYWCWVYATVYNQSNSDWYTNVASFFYDRGIVSNGSAFYAYSGDCCPKSGYYVKRQRQVENCPVWIGCYGNNRYPWIHEFVHGNGTYTWSRGE